MLFLSTVRRVGAEIGRDGALPPVAVLEQLLLGEIQLFAGLGGKFEIRALDDGIDRAGFLAEAAVDALHHVDVVAHRAARTIVLARASFDGDGLGWANCLAQLARYAALFAIGIAAQCMFTPETRAVM